MLSAILGRDLLGEALTGFASSRARTAERGKARRDEIRCWITVAQDSVQNAEIDVGKALRSTLGKHKIEILTGVVVLITCITR